MLECQDPKLRGDMPADMFPVVYDELGHTPGQDQLREYVEALRRQDGENVKVRDRQWDRTLGDLRPLFRRGG
jgi:hypothetical protein